MDIKSSRIEYIDIIDNQDRRNFLFALMVPEIYVTIELIDLSALT